MTRTQCKVQVLGRILRLKGRMTVDPRETEATDESLATLYPRDNYRTAEQPDRDYNFQAADVLEVERQVRRKLRL